jgi:hypothetical protein
MGAIATKKAAMGWVQASQRPGCHNCHQVDEVYADRAPPYDTKSWYCKLGGFYTSASAICAQHIQKELRHG